MYPCVLFLSPKALLEFARPVVLHTVVSIGSQDPPPSDSLVGLFCPEFHDKSASNFLSPYLAEPGYISHYTR
jgi:hypothetical protein